MDTYKGKAHLPGADKKWEMTVEMDLAKKEVSVTMPDVPGHISTWQGLAVQTYGDYEITFRTKGIPPRLTHWWHFMRTDEGDLWGIIIAVPDIKGEWTTCAAALKKVVS